MRGKPASSSHSLHFQGITPAHAGKTLRPSCLSSAMEDHPRACGENRCSSHGLHCRRGSPPRMRGKQRRREMRIGDLRITPAHAGKTFNKKPTFCCTGDHPRACGENTRISDPVILRLGSPPRMRGKHALISCVLLLLGITPAHAGKTGLSSTTHPF